jgi:lethal(2) giant larvae protein
LFLVNDRTRSLWIGTNGGHVYVYSIIGFEPQTTHGSVIATDHTNACSLAKEIRLKHKAPVLSIIVLDSLNHSIGQGSNIPTSSNAETPSPTTNSENVNSHKVLICSEEQFKVKKEKRNLHFYFLINPRLLRYLHYHI